MSPTFLQKREEKDFEKLLITIWSPLLQWWTCINFYSSTAPLKTNAHPNSMRKTFIKIFYSAQKVSKGKERSSHGTIRMIIYNLSQA